MKNLITIYTMNLLGRKLSIRRLLRPGFILMIPVFFGCETSEDLGVEYNLDSNANVRFIEFTLPAVNVYVDSLRTDGENRILTGNFSDELMGNVSAEGYFQFFYEGGPMPSAQEFIFRDSVLAPGDTADVYVLPEDTLKLDSMALIFESETVIPISGTSFQDFGIYELRDSLIQSAIYLSSLKSEETNLIGSYSKSISTSLDTIFKVELNQTFSESFFQNLGEIAKDSNRTVTTELFQSLAVIPNGPSQSISSFLLGSDTSRLIVYTSPIDPDSPDTTYMTTFRFTGKNYSHIDRTSSAFGSLSDGDTIEFSSGETILDPLYGITTTFSISEIEDFFQANENIIINNASISLSFRDEASRDTLANSYAFFIKGDSHFGPGIINNPFRSVVMNDAAYLNGQNFPATTQFNEDKDGLIMNPNLFFQTLYTRYNDNGSLVFELSSSNDPFPLNALRLISLEDVTLQRTIFQEDGVKLKIFYTEVD